MLDSTLSTPRWFTGTDGQAHLAYELLLTNAVPAPVTVNTVEVDDADTGATLIHLTGELVAGGHIGAHIAGYPEPSSCRRRRSSLCGWTFRSPAPPSPQDHASDRDRSPGRRAAARRRVRASPGHPCEVDRRPPVTLSPPLTGPRWTALGSCCDGPHRRALYPIDGQWYLGQRFAIDFNQLDAENRPGVGDPLLPASFPTFGQPVYAVADGTVVEAVDGNPDLKVNEAREDPTPDNAGGNRVAIDIGDGRFAFYAHLHQGSVAVRPGDHVTRGTPHRRRRQFRHHGRAAPALPGQ